MDRRSFKIKLNFSTKQEHLSDVDLHSLPTSLNKDPPSEMDSSSGPSSSSSSINAGSDSKAFKVTVTPGPSEEKLDVTIARTKVIGNGSFGMVYQARLVDTGELVAIKKVFQDKKYKNRELHIMRKLNHCNIVKLLYFYYSKEVSSGVFLHLVLEYVPETVYLLARNYNKVKDTIPIFYTKLYSYQLFRSLGYIHSLGICHRDIKPQNLLIDPEKGILKLCDFGSAKRLVKGEPNVSYICSRYYRAPELIFGATDYTTSIDIWSGGCVLAEMLMGQPIFPGDSGVDQLAEIINILGTPSTQQLHHMNPNYTEFKFPRIEAHPLNEVFPANTAPEALDLLAKLLEYTPESRLTPSEACTHAFYHCLREPGATLPNGKPLPPLFNFSTQEVVYNPRLTTLLGPPSKNKNSSGEPSSSTQPRSG